MGLTMIIKEHNITSSIVINKVTRYNYNSFLVYLMCKIPGIFEWSGVEAGQIGRSKCFYNTSGEIFYAKRKCSSNDEKQASWEAPDYTACATEKDLQILQMTSVQVTEENAVEYTENLKEMTNNMDDISSSGVESTVAALEEIENHLTPENTQSFVDISSNLLDASEDKLSNSKAR